jgi:ADP-heptose:LPS heptosyltransferase
LPALQGLRAFLPNARITALGARPALELLENDPLADELVGVQDFGLRHWGDGGSERSREAVRNWLHQSDFNLVIDPSHAVQGVAETIWQHHHALLDTGNSALDETLARGGNGVAAIKAAVRAGWGLEIDDEKVPALRLGSGEHSFAERYLDAFRLTGKRLLGISPVASSALKRWPVARLARVADRLLGARFDAVLIFHGPQRQEGARLLGHLRHGPRAHLVESLHLRLVAALLARCRLFICNDTGLLHLAAAVGVPVAGVFGPTSPAIYLPPAGMAAVVTTSCPHRKTGTFGPPVCIVRGRCLLGGRSCIDAIGTGDLLAALEEETGQPPCQ